MATLPFVVVWYGGYGVTSQSSIMWDRGEVLTTHRSTSQKRSRLMGIQPFSLCLKGKPNVQKNDFFDNFYI